MAPRSDETAGLPLALQGLSVGAGCYDITGPVAEVGLMGYGNMRQKAAGLQLRLRSRAFVFTMPCEEGSPKPCFVFVSADLWSCTEAVKTAVVEGLQEIYGPDLYTRENVLISGTHTHSGPGGFSHHALYNFSVLGFQKDNFDVICRGIVRSIVRAHARVMPARCLVQSGKLRISANRSKEAYDRNPSWERQHYTSDVDEEVTMMRIDSLSTAEAATPLGVISWFAMHPTSMDRDNIFVSGDNKGVAGYLFERKLMGVDYRSSEHFVAAFAQRAALGDVTPNSGENGAGDSLTRTLWSGLRQFEKTRELWEDSAALPGSEAVAVSGLRYAHTYVDFSNLEVELPDLGPSMADSKEPTAPEMSPGRGSLQVAAAASQVLSQRQRTAPAAIGAAGGAGSTADGPSGLPGLTEGQVKSPGLLYNFARELLSPTSPQLREAHSPKPVLLATGLMDQRWTPKIVPLQLLAAECEGPRRWAFALVAVPFELSTMAGRRLTKSLREALGAPDDCPIILAGLANAYAGYCTTFEEYQQQDYEGGMTMFGPHQLAALTQELCRLAASLCELSRTSFPSHAGKEAVSPPDLRNQQWNVQTGVVADKPMSGRQFGDAISDVHSAYFAGNSVRASFCAGHPKNSVGIPFHSFLEVQRLQDSTWVTHADDGDLETLFRWRRRGIAASEVAVEWQIPAGTVPGTFRLVHRGHARSLSGAIQVYEGFSQQFEVRPQLEVCRL